VKNAGNDVKDLADALDFYLSTIKLKLILSSFEFAFGFFVDFPSVDFKHPKSFFIVFPTIKPRFLADIDVRNFCPFLFPFCGRQFTA
jgi:hypothetical protein